MQGKLRQILCEKLWYSGLDSIVICTGHYWYVRNGSLRSNLSFEKEVIFH